MSFLNQVWSNHKTLILLGLSLLLIPFILPMISMLMHFLFTIGTYVGTWIRSISEVGLCA